MMEALRLGFGLCLFGGLLFGAAYAARCLIRERVPQGEIDDEARRLIAEHGADAVSVAEGHAQRAQWSKGNNHKIEKAKRVLKAVRQSGEFHG